MTTKVRVEFVLLVPAAAVAGVEADQPAQVFGVQELTTTGGGVVQSQPAPYFGLLNGNHVTQGVARITSIFGAAIAVSGPSPMPSETNGFRIVPGDKPIDIPLNSGDYVAIIEAADAPAAPPVDAAADASLAAIKSDADSLVTEGATVHTDAGVIEGDVNAAETQAHTDAGTAHSDAGVIEGDINAAGSQAHTDAGTAHTDSAALKADLDVLAAGGGGSVGHDYSANAPALPNVGANFGGSGPYAGYVLVKTVPAGARGNIEIQNTSGAQIVLVRDDGTASGGAAPANASVFALAGGAAAGAMGASWNSTTFKGRLQVYAASGGAQIAIFTD